MCIELKKSTLNKAPPTVAVTYNNKFWNNDRLYIYIIAEEYAMHKARTRSAQLLHIYIHIYIYIIYIPCITDSIHYAAAYMNKSTNQDQNRVSIKIGRACDH